MMDKRKIIYYSDELNDDFSVKQIKPKRIDENYKYCNDSLLGKTAHFFWYRIIFTPIAFFYNKAVFHHEIKGNNILKDFKGEGYFLYGNHTQDIGDAFIPHFINLPKRNYVIVNPANVSIPVLGHITPALGALPLPDSVKAYKKFLAAVEQGISEKNGIIIYPEAHVWPYYTKIRPFRDDSFYYPVKLGAPSFCFTNTYQKRRFSRKPRIVTYVDGPFYPDFSLTPKASRKELRDRIYRTMCRRSQSSSVEQIKYVKCVRKESTND
ncbi:MAG: hypothetical protein E7677_01860 [Ruminococcaceae bacterium]|nr:hypothetical protein [Oscillospiraceae bacterium]